MSALPIDRLSQPANQSWLVARQGQQNKGKGSPTWNTGMWSQAEIDQLKSNVSRYCQHHVIKVAMASSLLEIFINIVASGFCLSQIFLNI